MIDRHICVTNPNDQDGWVDILPLLCWIEFRDTMLWIYFSTYTNRRALLVCNIISEL